MFNLATLYEVAYLELAQYLVRPLISFHLNLNCPLLAHLVKHVGLRLINGDFVVHSENV